jgi:hypothetical protein
MVAAATIKPPVPAVETVPSPLILAAAALIDPVPVEREIPSPAKVADAADRVPVPVMPASASSTVPSPLTVEA